MKRVVFLLSIGVLIWTSCEKDPNFADLNEDFIVLTNYDQSYQFKNNPKTFYISDTITLLSSDATNPKWCNSLSAQIIGKIKGDLQAFGYTYVPYEDIDDGSGHFVPQYLVTVTAVKDMETVIYSYYPYWYDTYYPDYWWWGGYYPYYPYYPYVTGYSYDVGTTLIQLIDMQATPTSTDQGYPIRWNAILSGMLNTGSDMFYEQEAIDQAFTQSSSYLKVN